MTAGARVEKLADLNTLAGGASAERFALELKAVLENIRDPNTLAKAKRKITLEFTFLPDENRELVQVGITAKAGLAPRRPTNDFMYLGRLKGETVGTVIHGTPSDDPKDVLAPPLITERSTG